MRFIVTKIYVLNEIQFAQLDSVFDSLLPLQLVLFLARGPVSPRNEWTTADEAEKIEQA